MHYFGGNSGIKTHAIKVTGDCDTYIVVVVGGD